MRGEFAFDEHSHNQGSAGFGPYELYMLLVSTLSIIVLAADSLLSLSGEVHDVLAVTETALSSAGFGSFHDRSSQSRISTSAT